MVYQQKLLSLGRTLSVDPRSRTVAYAFFEDGQLSDCRVRNISGDRLPVRIRQFVIPYLVSLLDSYGPHALLVPETRAVGTRARSAKSRLVIRALTREAAKRGIAIHVLNSSDIKAWLKTPSGEQARNSRQVNREVLREYPELVSVLPLPRSKVWDPERYFTPLFNTVAMYVAWNRMLSEDGTREAA